MIALSSRACVAAFVATSAVACVSLQGLSGGDADAGADHAVPPADARSEASPRDATNDRAGLDGADDAHADRTVVDGGQEASHDAGDAAAHEDATHDAQHDGIADATQVDEAAHDAGHADVGHDAGQDAGTPTITFVSATQHDTTMSTVISATEPSMLLPGDLLFALLSSDDPADDAVPPSGWAIECDVAETTFGSHVWCYTHVVTASEPSSYAFTFSQGMTDGSLIIAAYRNVATSPFNVSPTTSVITGSPFTAAAITTTTPNAMVLAMFFDANGDGPLTASAGLQLRGTTDFLLLGDHLQASPGPTGTYQADDPATSTPGITVMAALNPG